MVKKCCIQFCKSESYGGCGISFHSFPKNEEIRKIWLNVVPVSQNITKNSVVCSLHFKTEDFYIANSRQLLKGDAIPSVFPVAPNKQIKVLSNIVIQSPLQSFEHCTPGTSQESSACELYTPPAKKFCLSIREVAVQTEMKCNCPSEDILKRKVKVLSQKLKRRENRMENLKSILAILKRKSKNYDEVENLMKNNFEDIHKHINTHKSKKGVRYSKELKQFALSLYFYSSKAYMFLRNYTMLPHPATLRKMLATHDCNVGFMVEVLEYLKLSVSENDLDNVALIFDAMSIKSEEDGVIFGDGTPWFYSS